MSWFESLSSSISLNSKFLFNEYTKYVYVSKYVYVCVCVEVCVEVCVQFLLKSAQFELSWVTSKVRKWRVFCQSEVDLHSEILFPRKIILLCEAPPTLTQFHADNRKHHKLCQQTPRVCGVFLAPQNRPPFPRSYWTVRCLTDSENWVKAKKN